MENKKSISEIVKDFNIQPMRLVPVEILTKEQIEEADKRFMDGFIEFLQKQNIDNENNQ